MTLALPASASASARSLSVAGRTVLVLALLTAAYFLINPGIFADGDTYWHLAAGEWIIRHRSVPDVDVFSHTRAGAPWVAHEWLSEVIMAAAFLAGGWSGLAVLFALIGATTAYLLVRRLAASLSGLGLALAALLGLAAGAWSLLARPHVLVLPILIIWTVELLRARDEDRAPRLAYAALVTLWANLHGSYVIAFVLLAFLGLEALVAASSTAARLKVIRDWGLFSAAALAAATLTPAGPAGLLHPFMLMSLRATADISEWDPASLIEASPFSLAVFFTLFVGLSRGARVPPVRLALTLLLLFMALKHARHALVLGLVAPLLLAPAMGEALGQRRPAPETSHRGVGALLAVVLLAVCLARLALPVQRTNDIVTPAAALAAVPAELAARPVLNDYSMGGYLIFRGVKPFVDGRADMYGDAFLDEFRKLTKGDEDALTQALDRYGVQWTVFSPGRRVVGMMDSRPGWRRLHADDVAVVHARMLEPVPN